MNKYELLAQFLGRWPLDKVVSMTLEEYTDINRSDSFCYWLERKTDALGGISGGSSYKFGIYKSAIEINEAPSKKVSTDGEYVWLNKYGKTREEVFEKVKGLIIQIIIASQEERFHDIDSIDLGDATKWKIAFLYSDFKLLNTFNRNMLLSICDELGLDYSPKEEISFLSQKILEQKHVDQDYFEFGSTFWAKPLVSQDLKKALLKNREYLETYFKVLDGLIDEFKLEQGDFRFYFSFDRNQLIFTIGQRYVWNIGSGLFKYIAINKYEDKFEEFGSGKEIEAYLNYTNQISNDQIILNRIKQAVQIELNRTSISGFRKNNKADLERLVFDKSYRENYFLNVLKKSASESFKQKFQSWLKAKTKETSNKVGSYMKALEILSELINEDIFNVSDLQYLQELYTELVQEQRKEDGKYYYAKSPSYGNNGYFSAAINEYLAFHRELIGNVEPKKLENMSENIISPLNQILYGPPGTGKTYNTINKAVAIANPSFDLSQDRAIVKAEYKRLVDAGQIVFTTFHQSMSYEDFVEGIKPIIDEDGDGNKQVVYEVQDGIFKEIVEAAKKIKIVNNEKHEIYSFDDAWNELIEHVRQEVYDAMNEFSLEILTPNKSLKVIEITDKGNLRIKPESVDSLTYTVSYARTKKLHEAFPDLAVVSNIDKEFRSVIGGSNSTAYWAVLNYINKKIVEKNSALTSIIELPQDNYVLIIDEINRGNVSAIFGELITLIEETKREGSEEALQVTLPYSKQKFSVPANLYLIGTMNTADRSVEALDTALRRRFVFEEMLPKPEILEQSLYGFEASKILKRINERIEKLIDRDHCIGHAYFIGKDESTIIDSFYKNIIPLLQEYFFGDYGKIGLVLGKGFVRLKKEEGNVFADFDYDYVADLASKPIYEIIDYRMNQDLDLTFEKAIQDLMR